MDRPQTTPTAPRRWPRATSARSPRRVAGGSRTGALHVCPSCDSELVYPVDWAPAERRRWSVDLRCPDCEWRGGGVYAQEVVDRFDEELDRGTEQLLADLARSSRANMEEQVERFVDRAARGLDPPRGLLGHDERQVRRESAGQPAVRRTGASIAAALGVALDHAVGDHRQQLAALRVKGGRAERRLRPLDPRPGVGADRRRGRRWPRSARRPARRRRRRALAGRASASSGSRSRARIRGMVTVPSSRSVPSALPVRSGGPVTSRTSSRSWKASPISRP